MLPLLRTTVLANYPQPSTIHLLVMLTRRYNFISHQLAGNEEGAAIQGLLLRYYASHPVIIINITQFGKHTLLWWYYYYWVQPLVQGGAASRFVWCKTRSLTTL